MEARVLLEVVMLQPSAKARLICASITPLDADGDCDVARFADHVLWLLEEGCDAVAVFGTTGEGASFSVAEKKTAIDKLLRRNVPADRLLVGMGGPVLAETVDLARYVRAGGFAAGMMLAPYYFKDCDPDSLHGCFDEVVDAVGDSGWSLIVYDIPGLTGLPLDPQRIAAVAARHANVICGVKDSGCDIVRTRAWLAALPGKSVYVGNEPDLPAAVAEGGAGAICGMANIAPRAVRALVDGAAGVALDRMVDAVAAIVRNPIVPAIKATVAGLRRDPAWARTRAPHKALPDHAQALCRALSTAGLLPAAD